MTAGRQTKMKERGETRKKRRGLTENNGGKQAVATRSPLQTLLLPSSQRESDAFSSTEVDPLRVDNFLPGLVRNECSQPLHIIQETQCSAQNLDQFHLFLLRYMAQKGFLAGITDNGTNILNTFFSQDRHENMVLSSPSSVVRNCIDKKLIQWTHYRLWYEALAKESPSASVANYPELRHVSTALHSAAPLRHKVKIERAQPLHQHLQVNDAKHRMKEEKLLQFTSLVESHLKTLSISISPADQASRNRISIQPQSSALSHILHGASSKHTWFQ